MAREAAERIAIESDADVVTARQRARALAIGLEMPSTDQTLLATAISEIARNITAYADLTTRPGVSNLNYATGQTIANSAVVPVGANGKVLLYNNSTGTVQLIADEGGYFLN